KVIQNVAGTELFIAAIQTHARKFRCACGSNNVRPPWQSTSYRDDLAGKDFICGAVLISERDAACVTDSGGWRMGRSSHHNFSLIDKRRKTGLDSDCEDRLPPVFCRCAAELKIKRRTTYSRR